MRVLFVSNFYPPAHLGGMELRLQELVTGLEARGHRCLVLTSDFAPDGVALDESPGVERALTLAADVFHYRPATYLRDYPAARDANLARLSRTVAAFQPDLCFFWGMWLLSPALIPTAQRLLPGRVAHSFAGYWPIEPDVHELFWASRQDKVAARLAFRLLKPIALSRHYRSVQWRDIRFEHAVFCSAFVRQKLLENGMVVDHGRVVFSGIDTTRFAPDDRQVAHRNPPAILYAGTLAPHKGVETLVEAFATVRRAGESTVLTLVGQGHPDFVARLEQRIHTLGLTESITLRTAVDRRNMPDLLREHDILVVPTLSDEPLSRMVMEGMACGLPVVASRVGGTPEMIDHGRDGLLFEPGERGALAQSLRQLVKNPALRSDLGVAARHTAVMRFDITRMIAEMERFLTDILALQPRAVSRT